MEEVDFFGLVAILQLVGFTNLLVLVAAVISVTVRLVIAKAYSKKVELLVEQFPR